jgi:thioredoxin 1
MSIVIKKFSKPSCNPCKILSVYLTEIDFTEHNATLVEIDIEDQSEVIDQYKLNSVPVLVFERNGIEMARLTGLRPVEEIEEMIIYAKEAK